VIRPFVKTVVLALAVGGVTIGGSPQQTPTSTFRSGRDILTIDAAVCDKDGRPVTDLQPSDFVVTIDGQPRRVLAAALFGPDVTRDAGGTSLPGFARASDTSPGRVVIFAVDRDSIRAGSERTLLESATTMLNSLSPADAVGVSGLPVGGIEATRDHRAAADAIRLMTGTRPPTFWRHMVTWEEALGFERREQRTIANVIERECHDRECPQDLQRQAPEMLLVGRGHATTVLTRLGDLFDRLQAIRAPKQLVLLSGGLPFDLELLPRYTDLAAKAAQAHISLSIVHLDQPDFDASTRMNAGTVFGGRGYATGLATIASSTGGVFVEGVGRATGALARIASDITHFYQLGVEADPKDADGKTYRVEVKVNRPGVSIRAPSQAAVPRPAKSPAADAVTHALAQPTDVAELPLEVATYSTHAETGDKVRVIVSATVGDTAGAAPAEWGYVVLDGAKAIGGAHERIGAITSRPWATTASLVLPSGHYRIRTALVAADGRVATLDLPLHVGLRAAGAVQASDVIIGKRTEGQLQPTARLTPGEPATAMIELSSGESLAGTTATIELTRGDTAASVLRTALELRARPQNATIVVAQATLDLSGLAPGTYKASVVLEKAGQSFGRVSRLVEVTAGAAANAEPARPASDEQQSGPPVDAVPAPEPSTARDASLEDVLQRVGRYVANYGEQAGLIIAVEHYRQRYTDAPLGEPTGRDLVAELALVKTGDTIGWVGFRDVVAVDGKPIRDRQDRLIALFRAGTPDLGEARRIADESARFNIGPTRRNFNDPTAALFFLLPSNQARFVFDRKGTTTIDGVAVMEIDFKERSTPTLIRTPDGRDVASQGTIWIAPADGAVVRTRLIVSGFAGVGSTARVEATFGRDKRLGLWLPVKMTERHEGRSRGTVTASATYGDFKRFETSTSTEFKN
jgi:VWFA-related protein